MSPAQPVAQHRRRDDRAPRPAPPRRRRAEPGRGGARGASRTRDVDPTPRHLAEQDRGDQVAAQHEEDVDAQEAGRARTARRSGTRAPRRPRRGAARPARRSATKLPRVSGSSSACGLAPSRLLIAPWTGALLTRSAARTIRLATEFFCGGNIVNTVEPRRRSVGEPIVTGTRVVMTDGVVDRDRKNRRSTMPLEEPVPPVGNGCIERRSADERPACQTLAAIVDADPESLRSTEPRRPSGPSS